MRRKNFSSSYDYLGALLRRCRQLFWASLWLGLGGTVGYSSLAYSDSAGRGLLKLAFAFIGMMAGSVIGQINLPEPVGFAGWGGLLEIIGFISGILLGAYWGLNIAEWGEMDPFYLFLILILLSILAPRVYGEKSSS